MNFLAHSYLSFNEPEILVGNMISDFVKGKNKFAFSPGIQQGIAMHRAIDAVTDEHQATKEAKSYLKPAVGLYAGAFVDVAFDHFLANDANELSDTTLQQHALRTYSTLQLHYELLPEKFQHMLPFMRRQNWLYNYKNIEGAQSSFGGVVRRAKYLLSSADAFILFQRHYTSLQQCYQQFFPFVKAFALQWLKEMNEQQLY